VGLPGAWKRTDSLPGRRPQAKPQGCGLAQAQTQADDQQEAGLAITHYKKGFTLHCIYAARSGRHLSHLNFNDQQAACRVFDIRLLKLNLRQFAAFDRKTRQRLQEQCKSTDARCWPCIASFALSENTSARKRGSRVVSGEVQFFERPFLNPFLRINLSGPVLLFSFHAG